MARPTSQALSSGSVARSTVSPSTTKATISARLASAPKNRVISRLYGAPSSPITMPAMNTARKPDPCATVATP